MLAERRRLKIIELVNKNNSVTIHELKEIFGVTLMTINRDLREVEKLQKIKIVRGGAISKSSNIIETALSERINFNIKAKQKIAEKAIKLIQSGDSLFLDASTTSIILAQKIKTMGFDNLTIITNSSVIINDLIEDKNINAICIGGTLLRKFHCFVGPLAELLVSQLRVAKFFFSASAISINGDLTDADIQEVNLKRKMIEASNEKFLMVESNKFNKIGLYKIVEMEKIDILITDDEKNGELFIEEIKNKGIKQII